MFTPTHKNGEKIKLSGFNNLTKVLSFNLYDFCITLDEKQRADYVEWINKKYNSDRIADISRNICEIIKADILAVSKQDYDPVGASTLVLMSDLMGGGEHCVSKNNSAQVSMHLDKSHITAHTYPDAGDPDGICTFRVDIDIATCGEIIPLKAMNYLFESFECDVVYIDYVVRGYTRLEDGRKIYNDHHFGSIQDYINQDVLDQFELKSDINMPQDNTWQTKLMLKRVDAKRFLMEPEADVTSSEVSKKMDLLYNEMREVYHMFH